MRRARIVSQLKPACALQKNVEPAPEVLPDERVRLHQLVETGCPGNRLARRQPTFRDGVIARRKKGGDLLQPQRLTFVERNLELLSDIARFVDQTARDWVRELLKRAPNDTLAGAVHSARGGQLHHCGAMRVVCV